jgi:hypothetical protein
MFTIYQLVQDFATIHLRMNWIPSCEKTHWIPRMSQSRSTPPKKVWFHNSHQFYLDKNMDTLKNARIHHRVPD